MGLSWEGEMRSSSSSVTRKSRLHLNLKVFISILFCHDFDIFFLALSLYKCEVSAVFCNFFCACNCTSTWMVEDVPRKSLCLQRYQCLFVSRCID